MDTKIFTPEKVIKYAETRLFGRNVAPEMAAKIELHNGALPSQLEQTLEKRYSSKSTTKFVTRVQQTNGREPIYFVDGTLFIPQFSGFGRSIRYERMIEAYIQAISQRDGRKILFEAHDLENDSRKTDQSYSNNAYDFVAGMFMPHGRYEDRRVFAGDDIKDITTIIFGTPSAVRKAIRENGKDAKNAKDAKGAKVVAANILAANVSAYGNSEYLEAQILEINNQRVLNIGYVFADQAGIIIEKILREYNSLACKACKVHPKPNAHPQEAEQSASTINKSFPQKDEQHSQHPLTINMYMFGRVGGLSDNAQRHQLVYPVGIIDWIDLNEGKVLEYPMHNVFAHNHNEDARFNEYHRSNDDNKSNERSRTPNNINGLTGLNLNVVSVVDETVEQLELAKQRGCICIEMETRESVEAINQARRRYQQLKINFGFVGYVSDIPLIGDTLEQELDSDKGEQDAVNVILDRI
ncbi:hypothetical protein HY636_03445 [Candidatus Woesearchaeota archaeon]|nr:hypothetical protein [Candidatus Woesearchaeota archaeon]